MSKYNFNKVKNVIPVQKYSESSSKVTQVINEGNSRMIKLAQMHSEETDNDSNTGILYICTYVYIYKWIYLKNILGLHIQLYIFSGK